MAGNAAGRGRLPNPTAPAAALRQPAQHNGGHLQPDVLVVCDQGKLDRRGVRGGPDLVVEVLSPSTASHDHVKKRRVY